MNKFSVLLAAITSLSGLLVLPSQVQAQSSSPECMGASLGALIGVLINPRANTSSAIPDHCRGDVNPNPQRPVTSQEINAIMRKQHLKMEQDRFERSRTYFPYNGY